MLSFVDVTAIAPLRIVVDAANGMAGAMLPPVLERLPVETVRCYFEPDGTFPNHEPNPLLPENREFIVAKTLEEGADFGVAFDGDADRCFFVDDAGEFVPGDFATALLAESILGEGAGREDHLRRPRELGRPGDDRARGRRAARQPRRPCVHQAPHARGGRRLRRRGLRPLLLPRLLSGRLGSRAVPAHARARLEEGRKLSEILRPFRERYFITGELNTPVPDVESKLQELEERFGPEGTVSHLDGVSVDADDWHFNVRPSNTEPLLRLNLEARSQELMEQKRDEVVALSAASRPPLPRARPRPRCAGCGNMIACANPALVLAERRGDLLCRSG